MAQVLNNPVVIVGGGGGGDNLWNDFVTNRTSNGDISYFMYDYRGNSVDQFFAGLDTSSFTLWNNTFAYCKNITTIPLIDTSSATNMNYMFSNSGITTVPLLNLTKAGNLSNMFEKCTNLIEVPLFDTSRGPIMSYMFSECKSIQSVPLFNTKNVSSLNYMFNKCISLTSVPLFDLSSATNVSGIFTGCTSLKTIEMNSWEKVTSSSSAGYMCADCYQLKNFIIRNATKAPLIAGSGTSYNAMFKNCYHFNGTFNAQYNPRAKQDGRIYIADELVDTLKAASHWSYYANLIYPISEYSEETEAETDILKIMPGKGVGTITPTQITYSNNIYTLSGNNNLTIWFNVPEAATNRTMKINFSMVGTGTLNYYLYMSHLDLDVTIGQLNANNCQYFNQSYVPSGEVIYENLPTGDHFIQFYWSPNDSRKMNVTIEFVE